MNRNNRATNPRFNLEKRDKYLLKILHVLSLLDMEQVFAFHGLLQQRSILQHQSLDLVQ